ncbi:hypothetical protein BJ085DRAFT_20529 [Dimargaris cristalligena]|uniref:Poly A polymerase head domain-containing protein n=1 Tax=Dimargaris cristalligena TaxID=215637 RepID=A0A4P9ZLY4_9FUNG|nr:hypothetical protein BJ085DRAFT_20529 [Dimargaris cristalligena]|eukprot:RKP34155.1 hypothetical protein BJ085DRAFT_20529 [Dimargaris cristalligena]
MTGFQLAERLNHFLVASGNRNCHVAKISSNPERSKHLETATMMVFDQAIDFVNLRSETYDESSRVPTTMDFGTPSEDAFRRDATVNALFYNIQTGQVEDFTKKGLDDLRERVIRTPLAAFETFRDDPLRILRCVRFASRFSFKLDPSIAEAVQSEDIRQALDKKISRERIGVEVDKMLSHENAAQAVRYLRDLQLMPIVFAIPSDQSDLVRGWLPLLTTKRHKDRVVELKNRRRLLYLSACLFPFRDVRIPDGKRELTGPQFIVRNSLKLSNQDMEQCHRIITSVPNVQSLVKQIKADPSSLEDDQSRSTRIQAGQFVRDVGPLWPAATLFTLCKSLKDVERKPQSDEVTQSDLPEAPQLQIQPYSQFFDYLRNNQLDSCHLWKHRLQGSQAASILGIKPGPIIGQILSHIMDWQILHPKGTEAECKAFVLQDAAIAELAQEARSKSPPKKAKRGP